MAARSPEPAKRCARPHAFSASAAGRTGASSSASTSTAAEIRAEGVIPSKQIETERKLEPQSHQHKHADAVNEATAWHPVRGGVDEGVDVAQDHEQPGQEHEQQIGLPRHQRENGHDVEQHRNLELVAEAIRHLHRLRRPFRLAQRDVTVMHLAAPERGLALLSHPDHQDEDEQDLKKQGRERELDGHGLSPRNPSMSYNVSWPPAEA